MTIILAVVPEVSTTAPPNILAVGAVPEMLDVWFDQLLVDPRESESVFCDVTLHPAFHSPPLKNMSRGVVPELSMHVSIPSNPPVEPAGGVPVGEICDHVYDEIVSR